MKAEIPTLEQYYQDPEYQALSPDEQRDFHAGYFSNLTEYAENEDDFNRVLKERADYDLKNLKNDFRNRYPGVTEIDPAKIDDPDIKSRLEKIGRDYGDVNYNANEKVSEVRSKDMEDPNRSFKFKPYRYNGTTGFTVQYPNGKMETIPNLKDASELTEYIKANKQGEFAGKREGWFDQAVGFSELDGIVDEMRNVDRGVTGAMNAIKKGYYGVTKGFSAAEVIRSNDALREAKEQGVSEEGETVSPYVAGAESDAMSESQALKRTGLARLRRTRDANYKALFDEMAESEKVRGTRALDEIERYMAKKGEKDRDTMGTFLGYFAKNPSEILPWMGATMASSLADVGIATGASLAAGAMLGGAAAGPTGGAYGAYREYSATLLSELEERASDEKKQLSPELMQSYIDDQAFMDTVKKKAVIRASAIGIADAVLGKASDLIVKKVKGHVARAVSGAVIGSGTEMAGEGIAQLAAEGHLNIPEVVGEGVGGLSVSPIVEGVGAVREYREETRTKKEAADKAAQLQQEAQDRIAREQLGVRVDEMGKDLAQPEAKDSGTPPPPKGDASKAPTTPPATPPAAPAAQPPPLPTPNQQTPPAAPAAQQSSVDPTMPTPEEDKILNPQREAAIKLPENEFVPTPEQLAVAKRIIDATSDESKQHPMLQRRLRLGYDRTNKLLEAVKQAAPTETPTLTEKEGVPEQPPVKDILSQDPQAKPREGHAPPIVPKGNPPVAPQPEMQLSGKEPPVGAETSARVVPDAPAPANKKEEVGMREGHAPPIVPKGEPPVAPQPEMQFSGKTPPRNAEASPRIVPEDQIQKEGPPDIVDEAATTEEGTPELTEKDESLPTSESKEEAPEVTPLTEEESPPTQDQKDPEVEEIKQELQDESAPPEPAKTRSTVARAINKLANWFGWKSGQVASPNIFDEKTQQAAQLFTEHPFVKGLFDIVGKADAFDRIMTEVRNSGYSPAAVGKLMSTMGLSLPDAQRRIITNVLGDFWSATGTTPKNILAQVPAKKAALNGLIMSEQIQELWNSYFGAVNYYTATQEELDTITGDDILLMMAPDSMVYDDSTESMVPVQSLAHQIVDDEGNRESMFDVDESVARFNAALKAQPVRKIDYDDSLDDKLTEALALDQKGMKPTSLGKFGNRPIEMADNLKKAYPNGFALKDAQGSNGKNIRFFDPGKPAVEVANYINDAMATGLFDNLYAEALVYLPDQRRSVKGGPGTFNEHRVHLYVDMEGNVNIFTNLTFHKAETYYNQEARQNPNKPEYNPQDDTFFLVPTNPNRPEIVQLHEYAVKAITGKKQFYGAILGLDIAMAQKDETGPSESSKGFKDSPHIFEANALTYGMSGFLGNPIAMTEILSEMTGRPSVLAGLYELSKLELGKDKLTEISARVTEGMPQEYIDYPEFTDAVAKGVASFNKYIQFGKWSNALQSVFVNMPKKFFKELYVRLSNAYKKIVDPIFAMNQAIAQGLSPEAVARMFPAFHGTHADILGSKEGRFSLAYNLTGEGSNAYGYGLYFAQREGVSGSYAKPKNGPTYDGGEYNRLDPRHHAADTIYDANGDRDFALQLEKANLGDAKITLKVAKDAAKSSKGTTLEEYDNNQLIHAERNLKIISEALNHIKNKTEAVFKKDEANLYKVDIKVEEEDMLDWHKPISEQSESVQKAVKEIVDSLPEGELNTPPPDDDVEDDSDYDYDRMYTSKDIGELTGKQFYIALTQFARSKSFKTGERISASELLVSPQRAASEHLSKHGISGSKHLDRGSRTGRREERTYNYVLFDDSKVEITHENGKPVTQAERKAELTRMADSRGELGPVRSKDHAQLTDFIQDVKSKNQYGKFTFSKKDESRLPKFISDSIKDWKDNWNRSNIKKLITYAEDTNSVFIKSDSTYTAYNPETNESASLDSAGDMRGMGTKKDNLVLPGQRFPLPPGMVILEESYGGGGVPVFKIHYNPNTNPSTEISRSSDTDNAISKVEKGKFDGAPYNQFNPKHVATLLAAVQGRMDAAKSIRNRLDSAAKAGGGLNPKTEAYFISILGHLIDNNLSKVTGVGPIDTDKGSLHQLKEQEAEKKRNTAALTPVNGTSVKQYIQQVLKSTNLNESQRSVLNYILKSGNKRLLENVTVQKSKKSEYNLNDAILHINVLGAGNRAEEMVVHEIVHAVTADFNYINSRKLSNIMGYNFRSDTETVLAYYQAISPVNRDKLIKKGISANYLNAIECYLRYLGTLGVTEADVKANGISYGGNTASAYDHYNKPTTTMPYGAVNLDEFMAESFSNPKFQKELAKLPSSNSNSKSTLSELLNIIARILGIPFNKASMLFDIALAAVDIIEDKSNKNFNKEAFDYTYADGTVVTRVSRYAETTAREVNGVIYKEGEVNLDLEKNAHKAELDVEKEVIARDMEAERKQKRFNDLRDEYPDLLKDFEYNGTNLSEARDKVLTALDLVPESVDAEGEPLTEKKKEAIKQLTENKILMLKNLKDLIKHPGITGNQAQHMVNSVEFMMSRTEDPVNMKTRDINKYNQIAASFADGGMPVGFKQLTAKAFEAKWTKEFDARGLTDADFDSPIGNFRNSPFGGTAVSTLGRMAPLASEVSKMGRTEKGHQFIKDMMGTYRDQIDLKQVEEKGLIAEFYDTVQQRTPAMSQISARRIGVVARLTQWNPSHKSKTPLEQMIARNSQLIGGINGAMRIEAPTEADVSLEAYNQIVGTTDFSTFATPQDVVRHLESQLTPDELAVLNKVRDIGQRMLPSLQFVKAVTQSAILETYENYVHDSSSSPRETTQQNRPAAFNQALDVLTARTGIDEYGSFPNLDIRSIAEHQIKASTYEKHSGVERYALFTALKPNSPLSRMLDRSGRASGQGVRQVSDRLRTLLGAYHNAMTRPQETAGEVFKFIEALTGAVMGTVVVGWNAFTRNVVSSTITRALAMAPLGPQGFRNIFTYENNIIKMRAYLQANFPTQFDRVSQFDNIPARKERFNLRSKFKSSLELKDGIWKMLGKTLPGLGTAMLNTYQDNILHHLGNWSNSYPEQHNSFAIWTAHYIDALIKKGVVRDTADFLARMPVDRRAGTDATDYTTRMMGYAPDRAAKGQFWNGDANAKKMLSRALYEYRQQASGLAIEFQTQIHRSWKELASGNFAASEKAGMMALIPLLNSMSFRLTGLVLANMFVWENLERFMKGDDEEEKKRQIAEEIRQYKATTDMSNMRRTGVDLVSNIFPVQTLGSLVDKLIDWGLDESSIIASTDQAELVVEQKEVLKEEVKEIEAEISKQERIRRGYVANGFSKDQLVAEDEYIAKLDLMKAKLNEKINFHYFTQQPVKSWLESFGGYGMVAEKGHTVLKNVLRKDLGEEDRNRLEFMLNEEFAYNDNIAGEGYASGTFENIAGFVQRLFPGEWGKHKDDRIPTSLFWKSTIFNMGIDPKIILDRARKSMAREALEQRKASERRVKETEERWGIK